MNFREALEAYEEGKKIRHSDWIKGFFIAKNKNNVINSHIKLSELEGQWELYIDDKENFILAAQLLTSSFLNDFISQEEYRKISLFLQKKIYEAT